MNSWYMSNLGDAMLAEEALEGIRNLFTSVIAPHHHSDDMAIFIRHESEGRLHCEVIAYFSPAVAHVADAVDAVVCNKPVRQGLGLLAGSENAWSILFPDGKQDQ